MTGRKLGLRKRIGLRLFSDLYAEKIAEHKLRTLSGGVAVVSYNNVNFGLVDRNGGEVSSFRYKRIGRFNDGLAPFNTDLYGMNFQGMEPRCGYIDTEGREVIPAKWDDAAEFSEMRAAVMRFGTNAEDFYDARWGYIATNGQLVVPLKYHEAYPFCRNV